MNVENEKLFEKIKADAITKICTARYIKDADMEDLIENQHTDYLTFQYFENTIKEVLERFEKSKKFVPLKL